MLPPEPDEPATDPGPSIEPIEPVVPIEPVPDRPSTAPVHTGGAVRPIHLALVVVSLLAGAALFLSGFSLGARTAATPGTPVGGEELWAPFWDTYHAITERYAGGDVDQQKLVEGAIDGMVKSLDDPYSSYLTPEEYKRTLEGISGQFEGIGAEIGTQRTDGTDGGCSELGPDCQLVIVAPMEGSPAERAGLRAGDVVELIDGESVAGLTVDESVGRVRGPKGTDVTLTIVRDGGAPFDLKITREVIVQKEVVTRDLAGGSVGYIRLTGFSDNAATDLVSAVRADIEAGRTKLVLDLRGNPGGFVTAARKIASQFIGSGPIYWQEDSQGNQVETDAEPDGEAIDPSIELVVLIDKGSASASEIVAGALQDTKRATLIGETSFGKGTVQQWQPLEHDAGGFRLTVAKWLTPDKRWIHHVGLTADVAVDIPADVTADQDPVLDKALEILGRRASSGPSRLDLAA